jgi:hypothetical protein
MPDININGKKVQDYFKNLPEINSKSKLIKSIYEDHREIKRNSSSALLSKSIEVNSEIKIHQKRNSSVFSNTRSSSDFKKQEMIKALKK